MEVPEFANIVTDQTISFSDRLFRFLENTLLLTFVGIVGSVVATFVYGPFLTICVVIPLLALHRSGALNGLHIGTKAVCYLWTFLLFLLLLWEAGNFIENHRDHIPTATEIKSVLEPLISKGPSRDLGQPVKQSEAPAAPPPKFQPKPPTQQESSSHPPSVRMVFYSEAGEPRFTIINDGDASALRPKWTIALSNYTNEYYPHYKSDPDSSEPLPIPTKEVDDFVKPHSALGNFEVFNDLTLPHIKMGDRVFGFAGISCMNCPEETRFWLYWEVGSGGWYAPISSIPAGAEPFKKPNLSNQEVDELLAKLVTVESRIAIRPGNGAEIMLRQPHP